MINLTRTEYEQFKSEGLYTADEERRIESDLDYMETNLVNMAKAIAKTINADEVVCYSDIAEDAAQRYNLCHQDAFNVADMVIDRFLNF